jgi:hypothetical protein
MKKTTPFPTFATLLCAAFVATAPALHAQSSCSSDGQTAPVALLDRVINADCEACWSDPATPRPTHGQLALDWIAPGSQGADAPLSAAATRDTLARLQALGQPVPAQAASWRHAARAQAGGRLRVAHGLPFAGYIGASIGLQPARVRPGAELTAWLALVETIPAGTEGTPVERNMVRNLLLSPWNGDSLLSNKGNKRFFESRPMGVPEGANPDRLRVVGWVQDTKGRITHIAQSRCAPPG